MSQRRSSNKTFSQLETRLERWLSKKGLMANPFDNWNAESDKLLPNYFVDIAEFDNLLRLTEPCIVFAQRGCGKTAQRKMLTMNYWPHRPDSRRFVISYTYNGFEQVLNEIDYDLSRLRPIHHVKALLTQGMMVLNEIMPPSTQQLTIMDQSDSVELLQNFTDAVHAAGMEAGVVLVDGLDEFPFTAGDLSKMATFLAPLLGVLPLIDTSRLAFKFFLPYELESYLRQQPWFRPDRLRSFSITWTEQSLRSLIKQRLTYFSLRQPAYTDLGELCADELAPIIDRELVKLSGLPRATLALASILLQNHCKLASPPDRITTSTWEQVKLEWRERRVDFGLVNSIPELETNNSFSAPPTLRIENGLVWLGGDDITHEIKQKEYQVLMSLYKHRDGICEKDTLVEEAWPDVEVKEGVTDQAIAASVRRLRSALEKAVPTKIEYIETITRRGYRLHTKGFHPKSKR